MDVKGEDMKMYKWDYIRHIIWMRTKDDAGECMLYGKLVHMLERLIKYA